MPLEANRDRGASGESFDVHIGSLAIDCAWEHTSHKEEQRSLQVVRLKDMLCRAYQPNAVKSLTDEELVVIRRALPPLMDHHKDRLPGQVARVMPVHLLRLNAWLGGSG